MADAVQTIDPNYTSSSAPAAPTSSPPSSPSPAPAAPQASPSVPGAGTVGAATATPAPASPPGSPIRDAIGRFSPQLASRFQDDNSALQHLLQAHEQAQRSQQYEPYVQQYIQNAGAFQQWQAEKQKQLAAQQADQKKWFTAPEFNPAWRDQVEQDPQTGEYRVKNGFSPDTLPKYRAALEHQRDFLSKFAFDPIESIKPGLEQIVSEMAQKVIQENLGQFQNRTTATDLVRQNSQIIHQRDANGNVVTDPNTGRPTLNPYGQRIAEYVAWLEKTGVTDIQAQWQLAQGLAQRDYFVQQSQQQQSAATGQQQQQQFLQSAAAATAPQVAPATSAPPMTAGASGGRNRVSSVLDRMRTKNAV